MSDSPNNHLDQISTSQTGKERKANEIFDSGSPGTFGGRRASTSAGLTIGFYGGKLSVDGVDTPFPAAGTGQVGTAAVTASATRYLECSRAGTFSVVSTPTPGAILLATMVTDGSSITSYTDNRSYVPLGNYNILQRATFAVTTADVTLTAAQARCQALETTGALTGNRNVIVPNGPQLFVVTNNCTGGFTLTVKTAAGTGVNVTAAATALLASDGTNVISVASGGGPGGTPGGSDTQVQFNDGGSFNGDAGLLYNKTTDTLTGVNVTTTGLVSTAASASGSAGLRVPHGSAPSTPTNGDVWTTSAGIFVRVNGVTVGPLGTAGGIGKHAMYISAKAMTPRSVNGCATYALTAGASGQPDFGHLDFDPSTTEYAEFEIRMPESWDEGTVSFRVLSRGGR